MKLIQPNDAIDRSQTDWYKDAIIYQLHVKAFHDSNGDGVGDFQGLIERLDYIQALGATAVWLLPFYPSPLRDDGYDISDYRQVNPVYGRMRDFRAFVTAAHKRGLRVITELVINHTSDQHPWFQRARHAKPGSAARDFYVWSDTDEKFPETRIIFTDTETSNWTWDPVAKAYFWHRFYSHQPDLNFDNPRVLDEVLKVMHLWLEMGVDGLRLDAIPYLVEREGTNNENLPETHEVLKKIRASLDERYSDRMLIAEANQWPEDTRPYFGEGDECHMGFHFPLMPRIYMALAREDRYPITDIIRQTPPIPENCQWGIFLRNHDELTLEMVTSEERDYLWQTYAADRRARINLGIRRRLAPLLQNDRRKIELLNSLLLSMPGTPILYYGDEIGMGDNYYLGDRDGVRTPMQWSSDRNAGFSRADPQQLYLPVIFDPVYGYGAINVERQENDPSSLLNWVRRLVGVRRRHASFGRGNMTLLYPANRHIIAYVREHEGETILCVANLSRSAQAVELDLAQWKAHVPVELTSHSPFPPIGDLPYLVTLPAFGFFWFALTQDADAPTWHRPVPEILPEFVTLPVRSAEIGGLFSGEARTLLETEVLPSFLPLQRWSGAHGELAGRAAITDLGAVDDRFRLALADVPLGGETRRYFMPLAARWGEENLTFGAPTLGRTLAKLRRGPVVGALVDATFEADFARSCVLLAQESATIKTGSHEVVFEGNERLRAMEFKEIDVRTLSLDQSNVSVALGDEALLKVYRRLRSGVQPEIEMTRYLTEDAGFAHTPAYLGAVWLRDADESFALASIFAFTRNQGDAWTVVTEGLERALEELALAPVETSLPTSAVEDAMPDFPPHLLIGEKLGRRTADLHRALARQTDNEAFAPRPMLAEDIAGWVAEVEAEVDDMLQRLDRAGLAQAGSKLAATLLERKADLHERVRAALATPMNGYLSRIHGDYHLGQVLVVGDDFSIIDFEGEPRRDVESRREKTSPLRDLAGILRSLAYAAAQAQEGLRTLPQADPHAVARAADQWLEASRNGLVETYLAAMADATTVPADRAHIFCLLDLFEIQKAAYEVAYELSNRPHWVDIPLQGLIDILDRDSGCTS
ncbi:trehalose synthase [Rhizobium albus]|nr:trehalose synthase [Rhizobium albus]